MVLALVDEVLVAAARALDADAPKCDLAAERLGIDSVWVPEYSTADALTPVAFFAARTSRIRSAT